MIGWRDLVHTENKLSFGLINLKIVSIFDKM